MSDEDSFRFFRGFLNKVNGLNFKHGSKEDIKDYLQEAQNHNIIDKEEAHMLSGILTFSEKKVRDVMIPKNQIVSVNHNLSFKETLQVLIDSGHSRFPVEEDGQVVGILLAKDLLTFVKDNHQSDFDVTKVMRSVRFIPESKRLDVLLKEFRYQRTHLAMITNEYGETAGLITIEDVLESIVGEIDDEFDLADESNIKKVDNNSYLIDALTEVDEFNEAFGTSLTDEQADTIGGHLMQFLGYVPKKGDKFEFLDLMFIVKEADDRRIVSLVLKTSS